MRKFEIFLRIFLAIYQILGGCLGIYLLVRNGIPSSVAYIIIAFIIFALLLYSIYCGVTLLENNVNAYKLTLRNQYAQIFNIQVYGFGYDYYLGFVKSFIGFTNNPKFKVFYKIDFSYYFGAHFNLNNGGYVVSFVINLILILLILIIFRMNYLKLIEIK